MSPYDVVSQQSGPLLPSVALPYAADSLYAGYIGFAASRGQPEPDGPSGTYTPSGGYVNYADPAPSYAGPLSGRTLDLLQMDPDPFGVRTARWANQTGTSVPDGYVASLDVFGRRMSRDQLSQSDAGRRLLDIAEKNRRGQKRSFWDAITDFSLEDLPFLSLFASVGKSVSDAVTVSDTFKKLQNGDAVTDDELIKTRLYLAESEYRENGTLGSTIGDIMRAAPGFMVEFLASGSMYSWARAGLSKAAKGGIHLGMTRVSKKLATEAMQKAASDAVSRGAVKGAEGFAALATEQTRKSLVDKVAQQVFTATMKDNPMYKGLTDDALRSLAKARAEHEFSKMMARNAGGRISNGFNRFTQWLGENASRGLLDYGAWGTEESTVMFTAHSKAGAALADAVGTFFVEAPIKGMALYAPNAFVAKPLLSQVLGQDGRTVSAAQLSLESSAYMTGNRSLMENAEAISAGMNLLEYVSENAGRGFSSLLRAGGLGLEKAGVRGLVRPAEMLVDDVGGMIEPSKAVTLGGKVREWVRQTFGTREDYLRRVAGERASVVAAAVGAVSDADRNSVEKALLSKSLAGLRPEIADKIRRDVVGDAASSLSDADILSKFAHNALEAAYNDTTQKHEFKAFWRFAFADWMTRRQIGPETVMNMFDRMGYDGVLGEMFEERYSDFAKGLFGWDDRSEHDIWSNLATAVKNLYPGWDQLVAEAVAFAMPSVMRAGIMRAQSAILGGGGQIAEIRSNLEGIDDMARIGTVGVMSSGEYLATHERLAAEDEARVKKLTDERKAVADSIAAAEASAVELELGRTADMIRKSGEKAANEARALALSDGLPAEQAEERARLARERREGFLRSKISKGARDKFQEQANSPTGVSHRLEELDADIARATNVRDRRKERHEAFFASVPEAARLNADELIAVPLYDENTLADDTLNDRTPDLTEAQARRALTGHTALAEYAPRLARLIYTMGARAEGEPPSLFRRIAQKAVGIAGFVVTGDFSLASFNPAQWTARDMGLSRLTVDGLRKTFADYVGKATDMLDQDRGGVVKRMAEIRARMTELSDAGQTDSVESQELAEQLAVLTRQYGDGSGKVSAPTRDEILNLAEQLAAPALRSFMTANLACHQLRSFTRERVHDEALGMVARGLGYEWSADRAGRLQFFKYTADGKAIDEATVVDAASFYDAHREDVDRTRADITRATVDTLTRRITKSGDESIRLMNAVSMPTDDELRESLQRALPEGADPVSADAVMREAAVYDAAMRVVGAADVVERVKLDSESDTPLSTILDRGSLGRVSMDTMKYLAQFDKVEDVPEQGQRAFEALAWSLRLPFDGTEEGLARRNRELFRLSKLITFFDNPDRASYVMPTSANNAVADRLTSNGAFSLSAARTDNGWVIEYGLNPETGERMTDTYATKDELDARMKELGFIPDRAKAVVTLARVIESRDMFHLIRELNLAPVYMNQLGANLHPMLRRDADGNFVKEDSAREILRAELALADGGKDAPPKSPARVMWEKVWGEHGYMTIGETLLRAHGVTKNVVAKYAGEFSDYSPDVYTLTINAGRISPVASTVYVPVDPLRNPDLVSGAVSAVLLNAFMSHPIALRRALNGPLADFASDMNSLIDDAVRNTTDETLKADLERFRLVTVRNVDRADKNDDGTYRIFRGANFTAEGFTVLANAFVLGRESDYKNNPHLRACVRLADQVRALPSFADFLNVVDLVLGGNGMLSAAVRESTAEPAEPSQLRGLARLMNFASADPDALSKKLRSMMPGGLDPVRFLDLCVRRLTAMAKNGAPAVSDKHLEELRGQARAASGSKARPSDMYMFARGLIAYLKNQLSVDSTLSREYRDFLRTLIDDISADPAVSEGQKKALMANLGILTRARVVDVRNTEAIARLNKAAVAMTETEKAKEMLEIAKKQLRTSASKLSAAKRANEATLFPNRWRERLDMHAQIQAEVAEARAALKRAQEAEQRARSELTPDDKLVKREMNRSGSVPTSREGLTAAEIEALSTQAGLNAGKSKTSTQRKGEGEGEGEGDSTDDLFSPDDEDHSVRLNDAVELPEAVALGEDETLMAYGADASKSTLMPRSTQRLAVNVAVRLVAVRDGADNVSEETVLAVARDLFHMSPRETELLRAQFRIADDMRRYSGLTWQDLGKMGGRWDFGEDDKSDESSTKEIFVQRAIAEYNSPLMADFLELAARVSSESGKNLRGMIGRLKEWLRMELELPSGEVTPLRAATNFVRALLDPRMDSRGKTQAQHAALFMDTVSKFDSDPDAVAGYVSSFLTPDAGGFPFSRKLAFLLAYMATLPTEDRTNFALICADSVDTEPVHVGTETGLISPKRVGAGDRTTDHIVGDTFVPVLAGASSADASKIAMKLRVEASRVAQRLGTGVDAITDNAKLVASVVASVFGRENPLVTALVSERAMRHRLRALRRGDINVEDEFGNLTTKSSLDVLADSVQRDKDGNIPLIEAIAETIDRLAESGEDLTDDAVTQAFIRTFEAGPAGAAGIRRLEASPSFTHALKTWINTYMNSLPATIMSAEIDQTRDTSASSVPVAPRDVVPMIARWVYSNDKATGVVDGKKVEFPTFKELLTKLFPNVSKAKLARCVQDACWPDGSPLCAKCMSASLTPVEVYKACELSYKAHQGSAWYVPVYAGEHSSSTLLRIPWGVEKVLREAVSEERVPEGQAVELEAMSEEETAAAEQALGDLDLSTEGDVLDAVADAEADGAELPGGFEDYESADFSFDDFAASLGGSDVEYKDAAFALASSVGLSLMFTDTKRSALSSLECQGIGLIGVDTTGDKPSFGEHRVHILHNWAFDQKDYQFKDSKPNEALLGTTRMFGYGARMAQRLAKDPESSLMKLHVISTSSRDLFFIKSLSVAVDPKGAGQHALEGTTNRAIEDYAASYRGKDSLSTDTYTDNDSYKLGVGNAKALRVVLSDGKTDTIMGYVFRRLRDLCGAAPGASMDEIAAAFETKYGRMTGEELDKWIGKIPVRDAVRDGKDAEPIEYNLSGLMPGAEVRVVPGLGGPCLDLSYREDGAMAYNVANVSHKSNVSQEPGRVARNYEIDLVAMLPTLSSLKVIPDSVVKDGADLLANWGLLAATVYSSRGQRDAAAAVSTAVEQLLLNKEHPYGQNIRAEVARTVWATVRRNANLPVKGVDAALVSNGASVDDKGRLLAQTSSEMHRAMLRGAELFTAKEREFFKGRKFRHALCNVNMKTAGFRYSWFLKRSAYDALDPANKSKSEEQVVLDLAQMFQEAHRLAQEVWNARSKGRAAVTAARDKLLAAKKAIAALFVDHHGRLIWDEKDPSKSHTEKYILQFQLADLFDMNREFDLTAFQFGRDKVHNDATGQDHILLGGTKFGFPRTPSYNGHMETVRAGLPVTEVEIRNDADEVVGWEVGRDAMVSPDPYTNKILGTDHDGDKSKLYLLHTDAFGLADADTPPPPTAFLTALRTNSKVDFNSVEIPARDAYLAELHSQGWLDKVWVNPETEKEELVPEGENPETAYFRISAEARLRASNQFVRTMFAMSDNVPVVAEAPEGQVVDRTSTAEGPRAKCLGGLFFSPTGPKPVKSDTAWAALVNGNISDPVLADDETVGQPDAGARVSRSAMDADGARGVVVALARALHVAYASGRFTALFGGQQPSAYDWMKFLTRFDGLSNATFDDIKEQICGRLGWTKGMMDTVLVELLMFANGLPTTDQQFADLLGAYSRNIKDRGVCYWMLKAATVDETDFHKECMKHVGVERVNEETLMKALGVRQVVTSNGAVIFAPVENPETPLQAAVADIAGQCAQGKSARALARLVSAAKMSGGHNATFGLVAYLANYAKTHPEHAAAVSKFAADWLLKHADLADAREFEVGVNYLTADPGNSSRYASADANIPGFAEKPAPGTSPFINAALERMATATNMMYHTAQGYATLEATAMLAREKFYDNLAVLMSAGAAPDALSELFVKDLIPPYDRLALTANQQQIPYLASLFLRQGQIASHVANTPLTTGGDLYNAVAAMGGAVAGQLRTRGVGLAAHAAIGAMFRIFYHLASTSTEADANSVPLFIRAPADSAFGEKEKQEYDSMGLPLEPKIVTPYGETGKHILRIQPSYRANDQIAHERVRADYDRIVSGESYAGPREGVGFDAVCRSFSISHETLRRFTAEMLPSGLREEFLNYRKKYMEVRDSLPENARWDIELAAYALDGLAAFMEKAGKAEVAVDENGKPKTTKAGRKVYTSPIEITPAMLFGQLLPLDSLMTSRCLGAPNPGSTSLLALAPEWMYEILSEGEASLSYTRPWLRDCLVAADWRAPLESSKAKNVAAAAASSLDKLKRGDLKPPEPGPADEVRRNPDWRTFVDIFTDRAFPRALGAMGPLSTPAELASSGPGSRAYDALVARVAGGLGLALGTWATVEYNGGSSFIVRGKLKGNMSRGRQVLFVVSVDGHLCDTDEQVQALADSASYGASLAEVATDLGFRSGYEFLQLPREVRIGLVRKYGVGGATSHKVDLKFSGRGVATLVGAIRLNRRNAASTTIYHEYFHQMMRVFDALGVFAEEDIAALRKTFGEPAKDGQLFNEEAAAESFRKWVEGKMDAKAKQRVSIFRKIYETLKGILLALKQGFRYRAPGEAGDGMAANETLFNMFVHGIAQASDDKLAELVTQASADTSVGGTVVAEAMKAAVASRDDVAIASTLLKVVPEPAPANRRVAVRDVVARMGQELTSATDTPIAQEPDSNDLRLAPAYPPDADTKARMDELTDVVVKLINDGDYSSDEFKTAMRELSALCTGAAVDIDQMVSAVESDVDVDYSAGAPVEGTPEAAQETIREGVAGVTTPLAEINEFYRTASFVHEALERGLREEGSWQGPLRAVVTRYTAPTGLDLARDTAVVVDGLRRALEVIDPKAANQMDDEELQKSLAFEATLRMLHSLESSFLERRDGKGPAVEADEAGERERAMQYQVGAWILSSRPTQAALAVRRALDVTGACLASDVGGAAKAELVRHRDALRKLLGTMDDPTKLMEFRNGADIEAVNEAMRTLRQGTKLNGHNPDGTLADITEAVDDAGAPTEEAQRRYLGPEVQESLKTALTAVWQTAAQVKFYRETDTVPATPEGLDYARQMVLRHNTPHVTPAEWAATQAIGDSNLTDNQPLVDFYCQPAFIADDPDAWLQSLVRKSFGARGNIGEMLSAENREFGALKMRIADLENFYSLLLGTNVEDGGALLKVREVTGKWKMRRGEVVREEDGAYLKIDNYRREPTKVKLTEEDLRVVDLYLKSIAAYASGQKLVITGVDRLFFSPDDSTNTADYSRDNVMRKWNDGHPTEHMNALEMALVRLTLQIPEDVLGRMGLWDRLVDAACSAMQEAKTPSDGSRPVPPELFNQTVLRSLDAAGLVKARADGSFGVVGISVDKVDQLFHSSDAFRKLTSVEGGRKAEWLTRDRIRDDFMAVYRDTVRFAKKHAWLMHGDGQHFHTFGTALPFWRGDGVFMYNAVRVERDAETKSAGAAGYAAKLIGEAVAANDADEPLSKLKFESYGSTLHAVGEAFETPKQGVQLAEAIVNGEYAEGTELAAKTGLVLSPDATKMDLAQAYYKHCLQKLHDIASGRGNMAEYVDVETAVQMFEESRMTRGELFGGGVGLNDEDMYRIEGVLPANMQIGHKVHIAIDGLTNAMMSRATLANLLMTPDESGMPVYYACPSEYAADVSGLPDEFWANIARWWAECNGVKYDASATGVEAAREVFGKIAAARERNHGRLGDSTQTRPYGELSGDDAKDCRTVERWLVRDSDEVLDETSLLNRVSRGEAMGYLKQFVQAGRTLGFGGRMTRATLHRALSWSKSMSVSFSLFFPLATKWESPIGAVGATATIMSNMRRLGSWMREHPEFAKMLQRLGGQRGWITQNFLGFEDIIEMMDTNDPFLAEMKAWANALGVTLSTSLVNPMEPTKSLLAEDLRWVKERIRDRMGARAAAKYGRIMDAVLLRQGDKAFNYALNATKLAVIAQMAMKLRYEAQRKGKAFDPVRDLRKYRRYINAEIGGIDPLQYAWATPFMRGIMNTLMFSWQWTRGAWEAGGGTILEDLVLGGHSMTKEEREYLVGRWVRMFGTVMIGVPALAQALVMGFATMLGGGDDDDDHWGTWQNEDKAKWSAFDLTPLLRAIDRWDDTHLGGLLRRFKQHGGAATGALGALGGAALGFKNGGNWLTAAIGGAFGATAGGVIPSLIPLYTGDDDANRSTKSRRYYMHFGKQGWEFYRWFDDAFGQFMSKLSMPTQRLLEGIAGRNLSYLDRALPWDDMGQFERWLNPTRTGAAYNFMQAFLPFTLAGVTRTGDAGILPALGPVQMGASQTNIQDRLVKAIEAWANNDRNAYRRGAKARVKSSKLLAERVSDVLHDARVNGLDPESQLNKAYGQVATKLYSRLLDLLPDDPADGYDTRAVAAVARALNRVGAKKESVLKSIKTRVEARMKRQGIRWGDLPAERRAMYLNVVRTLDNPYAQPMIGE